ncbi:MAG: hypothetical protein ACRDTA_26340 [Pseudonocardiaceae bacterium]
MATTAQVVLLDAVERLAHDLKVGVCVDVRGDVEVGVSDDPLDGVGWCLELRTGLPRLAAVA